VPKEEEDSQDVSCCLGVSQPTWPDHCNLCRHVTPAVREEVERWWLATSKPSPYKKDKLKIRRAGER